MSTEISGHIVKTARTEWKPLVEAGVDTTGISVKCLRFDRAAGRAPSFLLRFEPGAKYPCHDHPAGEELFVLSGSCVITSPPSRGCRRFGTHDRKIMYVGAARWL